VLVLDDFQQAAPETFDPLIDVAAAHAPPVSLIVLSRTRIDTRRGASTLARVRVEGIGAEETRRLLNARGLSLDDAQVSDLCSKTDGLPLAASIFATLVLEFGWEPSELLAGTMMSNERLRQWYTEAMAAVGEPARTLARFLAISDGPFNRGLVRQVRHIDRVVDADRALDELQRAYVVRPYSPFRWGIHQLISVFIAESIAADERRAMQRVYGAYYGRSIERGRSYDGADIAFLARACRYFVSAGDGPRAEKVVSSIAPSAKRLGQYDLLHQLADAVIAAFPQRSRWIDYHSAHAAYIVGHINASTSVLETLLRTDMRTDPTLALSVRRLYSECLAAQGQTNAALTVITDGLDEARDAHETAVANAKRTAAILYIELGELADATRIAHELLAVSARRNDRLGGAIAHALLSRSCLLAGDTPTSESHAQEALRLFREVGDQRGISWSAGLLCQALLANNRDDLRTAAALAAECVGIRGRTRECSREYLTFLNEVRPHFADTELAAALSAEETRLQYWVEEVART
jgi:tetratricopeptide (TPR) repeat protein